MQQKYAVCWRNVIAKQTPVLLDGSTGVCFAMDGGHKLCPKKISNPKGYSFG